MVSKSKPCSFPAKHGRACLPEGAGICPCEIISEGSDFPHFVSYMTLTCLGESHFENLENTLMTFIHIHEKSFIIFVCLHLERFLWKIALSGTARPRSGVEMSVVSEKFKGWVWMYSTIWAGKDHWELPRMAAVTEFRLGSPLPQPANEGQQSAHRAPLYKLNAISSCLLGWAPLSRAQPSQFKQQTLKTL